MRDIKLGITFYHQFTTRQFSDGVPTTLAGTPVLSVLEENNATPITSGVSVNVDRGTVTGLNEATVVATGANGFETGKSYAIYVSTGTVGGVSVVGEVVGHFTIEQAPVNWATVTNPTTAVDLSATDIQLCDTITTYTGNTKQTADHTTGIADIPTVAEFNARTLVAASYFDPAADTVANVSTVATLVNLPSITANWITTAGITDGAFTAAKFAASALNGKGDWNIGKTGYTVSTVSDKTGYSLAADQSAVTVGIVTDVTNNVGAVLANSAVHGGVSCVITSDITGDTTGNLSGSVGSVTGAVGSVTGNVDGSVGSLGATAKTDVNNEVLDVLNVDTFGEPGQGAPGATISIFDKISFLYKSWRNLKDNDGSTTQLYNDAGAVVDQKQTTSEAAGTVSKTEWISGP